MELGIQSPTSFVSYSLLPIKPTRTLCLYPFSCLWEFSRAAALLIHTSGLQARNNKKFFFHKKTFFPIKMKIKSVIAASRERSETFFLS